MERWLEDGWELKTDALDRICKVAQKVNNDIREYLGQSPSTVPVSHEAVLSVLRTDKWNPRESHERWREARLAQGWVYGEEYDAEKKTHPNLGTGYDSLPEGEQIKDFTFFAAVRAAAYFSEDKELRD